MHKLLYRFNNKSSTIYTFDQEILYFVDFEISIDIDLEINF